MIQVMLKKLSKLNLLSIISQQKSKYYLYSFQIQIRAWKRKS